MEGSIGIAYSDKPEKAIEVIKKALSSIDGLSENTKPQVGIAAFGDSAIDIEYRVWIPAVNYFALMHEINLAVFNALCEAKINIPFPQREVKMI